MPYRTTCDLRTFHQEARAQANHPPLIAHKLRGGDRHILNTGHETRLFKLVVQIHADAAKEDLDDGACPAVVVNGALTAAWPDLQHVRHTCARIGSVDINNGLLASNCPREQSSASDGRAKHMVMRAWCSATIASQCHPQVAEVLVLLLLSQYQRSPMKQFMYSTEGERCQSEGRLCGRN